MTSGGEPKADVEATATLSRRGSVAEIALSAGPLNLVTRPLLQALNLILSDLARDTEVRCVILHGGRAKAFCAGSDIKEFAHLREDASERKILFEDLVLRNLARLAVPTIAALDGPALGGGLEIALACDLRVAAAGVKLGLTECRLGGLAGNGSIRLARLVGPGRAKELLFTGEIILAEQALAWGIVNRIAPAGVSALDLARTLSATISERGPLSNRFAKTLVDAAHDGPIDAAISQSTVLQQKIFDSDDLKEGMTAFFAKRPPTFSGR